LAEGLHAGGTCVDCGNLVTLGADSGGDGGAFEHKEVTTAELAPAENSRQQGERWAARGWGKRRRLRRTRVKCRGVEGQCGVIDLANALSTCECLNMEHVHNSAAAHVAGVVDIGTHFAGGNFRMRLRRGWGRFTRVGCFRPMMGVGDSDCYPRLRHGRSCTWNWRRQRPRAGFLLLCANHECCVGPLVTGSPLPNPSQNSLRGGRRGGRDRRGKTVSPPTRSERLLARHMELARVSTSSPASLPALYNTPSEQGQFSGFGPPAVFIYYRLAPH
jgi:hypothetical protein